MEKRRIPPEPLTESDFDDIRDKFGQLGVAGLAEWIGCDRTTVRMHAKRLGVWPSTRTRRQRDLARETLGVTRVCRHCDQVLPLDEFFSDKAGRQGRSSRCKACERVARRQRYQREAAKVREARNRHGHAELMTQLHQTA